MSPPGLFDLAVGVVILVLVAYGMLKGIVRLVLWFGGIALAWMLAVRYCEPLAMWIGATDGAARIGPDFRRLATFALIFVAVTLGTTFLASLITRALGAVRLGCPNRLAGAGAGLLLAIVLVCAGTVPLVAMLPPEGRLIKRSVLAPYAVAGGEYLEVMVPEPLRTRFSSGAKRMFEVNAPKPAPSPRQH